MPFTKYTMCLKIVVIILPLNRNNITAVNEVFCSFPKIKKPVKKYMKEYWYNSQLQGKHTGIY